MSRPRLWLVAAVARNGVIGAAGKMPWRLSSDLKRFKELTLGHPVLMGHRTFDSIGKPLPGRLNIVLSRHAETMKDADGLMFVRDVDVAVDLARYSGNDDLMVIGGGEVYAATIGRAFRLCITHVDAAPEGDTYFPDIDPAVWKRTWSESVPAGDKDSAPTTYVVYDRVTPLAD
ncbi:MAG TPA: dihydrofolate reductase [Bauldia sp.]|nr:dihydrofolate reductase [Bauldia sp.]